MPNLVLRAVQSGYITHKSTSELRAQETVASAEKVSLAVGEDEMWELTGCCYTSEVALLRMKPKVSDLLNRIKSCVSERSPVALFNVG